MNKRVLMGVIGLCACAAEALASLPEPTVWFKADAGVVVEDGKVVQWQNQGSLGAGQDLYPSSQFTGETPFAVAENETMGTVVRFDGSNYLEAKELSKYGLTNQMTVLMVFKSDRAKNVAWGLWSSQTPSTAAANNYLSFSHTQWSELSFKVSLYGIVKFGVGLSESPMIAVSSHFPSTGYGYANGAYSDEGSETKSPVGLRSDLPEGLLRLGVGYGATPSQDGLFKGDFAEFRLYNVALTAAQRFQVECELAAKYGIAINPVNVKTQTAASQIPASLLKGQVGESAAFGDAPAGGPAVAEIPVSGTSCGLTASFVGSPAADANSLVYLAGNGKTGVDGVWCLAGAPDARALPMKLTFAHPASVSTLYRTTAAGEWEAVPAAECEAGAAANEIVLKAGWQNARYAISLKTIPAPTVWFKSDTGVTVENGQVVAWANQGSLGRALDLVAAQRTGATGTAMTLTNHAYMGPVVTFDGTDFFRAVQDSNCGLDGENKKMTMFVVLDNKMYVDTNYRPIVWGILTENAKNYLSLTVYGQYAMKVSQYGGAGFCGTNARMYPGRGQVISSVVFKDGVKEDEANGYVFSRGARADDAAGTSKSTYDRGIVTSYGRFALGGYSDTSDPYVGSIAEFRLYNVTLTAAQRFAVECELAAKYGLDINPVIVSAQTDASLIPANVLADCTADAVAFGSAPKAGRPMSEVVTSATSAGLTASFASAPAATENSLVYLARHKTATHEWVLAGAPDARTHAVRLGFDAALLDGISSPIIRYKAAGAEHGRRVDVDVLRAADGSASCELPANWQNGRYTLESRLGLILVVQ